MNKTDFKYLGPAERLAAYLAGERDPLAPVTMRGISLRLPVVVVARMDAMAARTEMSRNEVASLLIAAGFEAALDHASVEIQADVEVETQHLADQLLAQGE